ncbi:FAS1-like dehydratase domain-containing protein [Massilibacterium senegalense]|uniref:FAS1-like dehydratase domain-containing protein n=1 Tax=Massilibacterium senegalense TaxID=1632858 RepID=UPI000784585F|nr:MaoC family dehydratase N-terminal domain-containing protein [Massilibacterium senegalense]
MTSRIGSTFPRVSYRVEKGKIREFVLAIQEENPIYIDKEAAKKQGLANIPIPPTFPTAMEMWSGVDFEQLIQTLQLNPAHVLHAKQSYEYMKTVYEGDELWLETTVIDEYEKKSLTFIELETIFLNERGEQMMKARSLIVEKNK